MPIYEYQCQSCGHQFETTQRITEDPLKDCPTCNQPKLERLISPTLFVLKGGGWYKDGYGNPTKPSTDNQGYDRLQKALDADKKKTAAAEAASTAASTPAASASDSSTSTSPSTTPSSGGGGSSSSD